MTLTLYYLDLACSISDLPQKVHDNSVFVSEEKPKQKKKVVVKLSPPSAASVGPPGGEQGSGSLRHLLTTKTVMEPP